jgi:hypothetical protein
MPKILEDRRKAIQRSNPNMPESSTWAIATSALQKEGKMPRKRYDAGGKVSESEDTGTANARADQISAEQAIKDYGRGHTWIENRAGTINPEPRISPFIQIYPRRGDKFSNGGIPMGRSPGSFAQGGPSLPRTGVSGVKK